MVFKKTALAQKQNIRKKEKLQCRMSVDFNSQISSNSSAPTDQHLLPEMCNIVTSTIKIEKQFFMKTGDLWLGIITVHVLVS